MKEISVVIPIFNAAEWIEETVERTEYAIQNAGIKRYEIIIVNDGSTDNIVDIVQALQKKNKKIRFFSHRNSGRFITRKVGVEEARYDRILFVDARTWIDEESLAYLSKQVTSHPERRVWNAHINVEKKGNIIARFGDVITLLGWRRYFKKPRLTSFGLKDFDYYPKGTGLFSVPTQVIKEAIKWFEQNTTDVKNSSDDTLLIRHIAASERIWLSPQYSGSYFARTTLPAFIKHTYNRGKFFVDGFLRPGTRFFYPLIITIIASIVGSLLMWFLIFIDPALLLKILFGLVCLLIGILAIIKLLGIGIKDVVSFGLLLPIFCIAYILGIWSALLNRGLFGDNRFGRCMNKYRPILRGTIKEYTVVAVLYALIVIPVTGFTLFHINHQIFSSPGDATAGFLWLNATSPGLNLTVGHTDNVNYPIGQSVGGWTLVSYAMYWLPMRLISFFVGPIVAMNVLMLFAFVSSGVAMYWLVKRVTGKKLLSFFAGYALAFVPYAVSKSVGHFSYLFSAVFPLSIGVFLSLWQNPSLKKAIMLGLLLAIPFYTDGYFMLMSIILGVTFAIAGVIYLLICRYSLLEWRKRAISTLVTIGVLLIALIPLIYIQLDHGSEISSQLQGQRSEIEGEIRSYRSNVADFLLIPQATTFFDNEQAQQLHSYNNQRSNGSENNNFISPFLYMFSTVSIVSVLIFCVNRKRSSLMKIATEKRNNIILVSCVCVIGAVLTLSVMFSPEVIVGGVRVPLLGGLLIDYNITFWRVLSRVFVLFNVFIVLLGSIGIWIATTSRFTKGIKSSTPYIIVMTVCMIGTAIFYAQSFSSRPYDFNDSLPKTYYWLRNQEDIHSVAELPVVDPLDARTADYLTAQIIHKKDLVNLKEPTSIRLNNALGVLDNPELSSLLLNRRVDAVIYHSQSPCQSKNQLGDLIHEESGVPVYDTLKKTGSKENICVYRIKPSLTDPVFIRFDEGFTPSPNALNQSEVVMGCGATGKIAFTYNDFSTPYEKDVHFTADIINTGDYGTGWELKNNKGRVVLSGLFTEAPNGKKSVIDIRLRETSDLRLTVTGPNSQSIPLGQVYLRNAVVSAI